MRVEDEEVRTVQASGEDFLRVGPGQLMLGLRRKGSRRQLLGRQTLANAPLPHVPLFHAVEGLRRQTRQRRLHLQPMRRLHLQPMRRLHRGRTGRDRIRQWRGTRHRGRRCIRRGGWRESGRAVVLHIAAPGELLRQRVVVFQRVQKRRRRRRCFSFRMWTGNGNILVEATTRERRRRFRSWSPGLFYLIFFLLTRNSHLLVYINFYLIIYFGLFIVWKQGIGRVRRLNGGGVWRRIIVEEDFDHSPRRRFMLGKVRVSQP